ncbi:MAG: HaeIII family restriction endonuclease [Muribaculaceae bacterium]|nr:HaeIII family restriction endonuclease [Muribaculaceae bacterium]
MSTKSNIQGRAYEYACLLSLFENIGKIRSVQICETPNFFNCKEAWEKLSVNDQNLYILSASAAVVKIFELEPRIIEESTTPLQLFIQSDKAGEEGDVRDILIIRDEIEWEIGLSLKHNHFAVKHSRLASKLDFANSWFNIPCSHQYWTEVSPIFNRLEKLREQNAQFKDIENKDEEIYIPILKAFIKELTRLMENNTDVPGKLVEYLLGRYDFYKVISVDSQEFTTIQSVNLHGTLNQPSSTTIPALAIPKVKMPTRLIHLGLVPESTTTVELYLDGGWQFTFRIHNASSRVEPSLKFDIKIIGMPTAVITLNCRWI